MSIKIRCSRCRKKITIDEAFAGGICRCPYCKSLVDVPEQRQEVSAPAGRPDAPSARPAAPAPTRTTNQNKPQPQAHHEHIHMANPVMLQGTMSIVLGGLFLVMLVVGIIISVKVFWPAPAPPPQPPPKPQNPYQTIVEGAAVAGDIEIVPPVVYCLDTGASMREYYGYAELIVASSLPTLDGGKFSILLIGETKDEPLADDYLSADVESTKKAKEFMRSAFPGGAGDVPRGLRRALEKNPATVVLIARKEVGPDNNIAENFKSSGAVLVVIALTDRPEVIDSLKSLAQQAGGKFRALDRSRLDQWAQEATER